MSRTDKDRPWWVVQYQDDFPVAHDHRAGECRLETFEYARARAAGNYSRRARHWRSCTKRLTRTFYCTKREPYTYSHYRVYWWKGNDERYRIEQECWTWRCRCGLTRGCRHRIPSECPTWGRVQCDGHTETTVDWSIPCICDDWPEPPTCDRDYRWNYHFTRGGAPSWSNRLSWTKPERRRERDDLRDLAREYNAYGDIEDDDFPNYQHRHEGVWNWW